MAGGVTPSGLILTASPATCATAKATWTAHEGPSDTKDTKIVALRLKFNAFKALEGEKVNGTFTRLKYLLIDLENNGFSISQAKDSDLDAEEDTRSSSEFLVDLNAEFHDKALLANQKRFYKRSERVGSSKKTMDKSNKTCFACGKLGLVAESFDWDEEPVSSKDEWVTKVKAFMAIAEEEPSVGKGDARSGDVPNGTSPELIYLADLTQFPYVFDKPKKVPDKERVKSIKKKAQIKSSPMSPFVPNSSNTKNADSSTEQLLLTLMEEEHPEQAVVKKTLAKLKAQSLKGSSLRKAPLIPKPFIDCKYCGFNDHHSDECVYYPRCDICGSIAHETTNCTKKPASNKRKPRIASQRSNEPTKKKMENLNEVKMKELRSDNGTEFRNHKLEEFCDEKCISQNFSSPCTPEHNGVVERRNKTLIEAARTMLNSANLPKQFWREVVNTACYTQNRSIIVKRHQKIAYDVRGRSPNMSYFHVFGCLVHIHNHREHLRKFDAKADDGFFLSYSLVAKAFRGFSIRRQEIEESYHVTISEDDETISKSSITGDQINFNENRSFPDDEFLVPRNKVSQCSGNDYYFPYVPAYDPLSTNNFSIPDTDNHHILNEHDNSESLKDLGIVEDQVSTIIKPISNTEPSPTIISPSAKVFINPPIPQDRWSRENHIELVNILGEPQAGIEPKKLIEALEKEGWIIAMQKELNQFERNKAWTLVPIPHGKTIIGTKWI
ncbi:retrovirus-related pol polyprotein from transposon TNT 1-94 [Tanacetum coccineum]